MPMSTTHADSFVAAAVSNTALTMLTFGFTQAQINAAERARITCASNAVRYRYDGVAPDASTGHLLAVSSETIIEGNINISQLQFIRATGSDGALSITLEKY